MAWWIINKCTVIRIRKPGFENQWCQWRPGDLGQGRSSLKASGFPAANGEPAIPKGGPHVVRNGQTVLDTSEHWGLAVPSVGGRAAGREDTAEGSWTLFWKAAARTWYSHLPAVRPWEVTEFLPLSMSLSVNYGRYWYVCRICLIESLWGLEIT